PQNDVTLKMPAFEWVHVQLHQQKGMISLSPPTICNSAVCCYGKVRFLYCTREYPDCDAATTSAGFLNGLTPLHVNDNHYH
ncbi:hypothetical protein ACKWPA_17905, partial [Escherichia coli]|uniref:hypothetical protein n=1 Tax=Escherichia coli TaxID=562 RepID=UPI0039046701